MTDEEQEARSYKFDGRRSVTLQRLSNGRWAMYPLGGIGSPFWIGDTDGLVEAYDGRPMPQQVVARTSPSANIAGIDLSKVEFEL